MSLFQPASDDLPPLDLGLGSVRAMSIDSVALLFQSILQEERIAPSMRIWLARLQMPLIRHALAQPTIFGNESHPSMGLVTHMVSCLLNQENHAAPTDALEREIHRLVVVIEKNVAGGRATCTQAHAEFKAFLARHQRAEPAPAPAAPPLSDAVCDQEQVDLFTVQYTILLRHMLNEAKARPVLMEFLFKVWAEVLALSAVRYGHQDPRTLALKQAVTALIWATGAKETRRSRARAIKEAPELLQLLRSGMDLLGLPEEEKTSHITALSAPMMDAFVGKKPFVRRKPTRVVNLPGLEVIDDHSSTVGWHLWESAQWELKESFPPANDLESAWTHSRGHRKR